MSASIVFDRCQVRKRRARASATLSSHDFLLREAAERLSERLDDITHTFPLALDLGAHHTILPTYLAGRGGIQNLLQCDIAKEMLGTTSGMSVVCDEEWLPFAENSLDAVFSLFSLQQVNDLPGTLIQILRALKPDGLFIATVAGGTTLQELRESLSAAEIALSGGMSPRISPFLDVRDAGALLQRAGFALPVVDSDTLTITYPSFFSLLADIRGAGYSNALVSRLRTPTSRRFFAHAAAHYAAQHSDAEGRLKSTCELVTLTAWKPAESQQQPAKRSSATASLRQALR